jgi:alpha-ribazole phosphatase
LAAVTRWWWIRHGPPAGADAAALATLAGRLPAGAVWVASHLRRAQETAAALYPDIAARLMVEPAIAEQDFGAWEGRSWNELAAAEGEAYAAFWREPASRAPPGGESFRAVVDRVGAAVARLNAAHRGRDIVAVAHAGSVRAALALALAVDAERALAFAIDHCSLTRLDHVGDAGRGAWRVIAVNMPAS